MHMTVEQLHDGQEIQNQSKLKFRSKTMNTPLACQLIFVAMKLCCLEVIESFDDACSTQ